MLALLDSSAPATLRRGGLGALLPFPVTRIRVPTCALFFISVSFFVCSCGLLGFDSVMCCSSGRMLLLAQAINRVTAVGRAIRERLPPAAVVCVVALFVLAFDTSDSKPTP